MGENPNIGNQLSSFSFAIGLTFPIEGGRGGGEDPADWDPDSFLHLTLKGLRVALACKFVLL